MNRLFYNIIESVNEVFGSVYDFVNIQIHTKGFGFTLIHGTVHTVNVFSDDPLFSRKIKLYRQCALHMVQFENVFSYTWYSSRMCSLTYGIVRECVLLHMVQFENVFSYTWYSSRMCSLTYGIVRECVLLHIVQFENVFSYTCYSSRMCYLTHGIVPECVLLKQ